MFSLAERRAQQKTICGICHAANLQIPSKLGVGPVDNVTEKLITAQPISATLATFGNQIPAIEIGSGRKNRTKQTVSPLQKSGAPRVKLNATPMKR